MYATGGSVLLQEALPCYRGGDVRDCLGQEWCLEGSKMWMKTEEGE